MKDLQEKRAELSAQLKEIENQIQEQELSEKDKWKQITSFEKACEVTGDDANSEIYTRGTKAQIALEKLAVIVKAINGGWTPDFTNSNQYKYFPYFDFSSSSGGFVPYGYHHCCLVSFLPLRLLFESIEKCEWTAKQHIDLYKDYIL